jgi:drug/metabolite transporter (DMT)-like permease
LGFYFTTLRAVDKKEVINMHFVIPVPSAMQRVSIRAIFYMLLSALCFAAAELVAAHFVRGISQIQLVWGRYAVHLLFMITVLGPRYKRKLVMTKRLGLHILRSLTMLVMPAGFILAAAAHFPIHDALAVYWLSPLIMLALSTVVLHERIGGIRWIAGIIGFGATLIIYKPDHSILSPMALLTLSSGLAISLHLLLSRILREDHPLTSLFHTALWVFLIVTFIMPFVWQRPSGTDIAGIISIGVIGLVGLLVLARAGELMPLSVVAFFSYTDLIWVLILNVVFFGILPQKHEMLGALIIASITIFLFYYEVVHVSKTQTAAQPA